MSSAAPTRGKSILAVLGIRSGEEALVGWIVAAFTVIQSSEGMAANAADALFFLRFGVDQLPLMILLSGPAVMVFLLGHSAGLARVGPHRWLWVVTILGAGWAVLQWLGIQVDLPGVYPVVWISTQVIIMVSYTVTWNAAGAACTTRQAKRLFPLFATAGVAGGVLGNLLTGPLANLLGTENLLLMQAGLLVAGAGLLLAARRRFLADTMAPPESMGREIVATWTTVRSSRMLRLAAGIAIAVYALFTFVYFPFSTAVADSIPTEAEIASFLGLFSSVATASTFLVSLLVTNRLFARFGLVISFLLVPLVYVGGFTLWLGAFSLTTAVVVRGLQWVTINAVGGTAFTALFNVVTGRRRAQVVSFMTAVPGQIGTVVAGAVLLAAGSVSLQAMFVIGLGISLACLVAVVRLRPAYLDAIVDAVKKGVVGVFDTPAGGLLTPKDADTRRVLKTYLRDERPEVRALALTGLSRSPDRADAADVEALLSDSNPAVRSAAFDSVCVIDPTRVSNYASTAIGDQVPEVRLQVIHYLAGHPDDARERIVGPALNDPDPRVRAAAAALLGGIPSERAIANLLASGEPESIAAALEETGLACSKVTTDPVPFLSHPSPGVRAAAASALTGREPPPAALASRLDDRSTRVRREAAAALASTEGGRSMLVEVLEEGSVIATEAVLGEKTAMSELMDDVGAWARSEAERAAHLLTHAGALEVGPTSIAQEYLGDVLRMRSERMVGWVLSAMTTEETKSVMPVVARGVRAADQETKAQAIEALETVGARDVLAVLVPLLEPDAEARSMGRDEALRSLADDFDPWIRSLASRTLGDLVAGDGADVASWPSVDSQEQPATLSPMDRVLVLQRASIFSGLDPEDLDLIARVAKEARHEPGATIYNTGDRGDEMMVIVSGNVVIRAGDGRSVVAIYGPGEPVGELALLGAGVRTADVEAGDDGLLGLVLSKSDLVTVLEERAPVAMRMLETLARRLADQTSRTKEPSAPSN